MRIHLQFINNSKQYRTQVVDGQRVRAGVRQIRVDGQAIRSRQAAGIVIGETVRVLHRQAEQTGNKRSEVITGANQDFALRCRKRRERHRANQVYALTTHQLQVETRERYRANQVYVLTTHQLHVERRERQSQSSVCSHHTPSYRWRGERDIEPIKSSQVTFIYIALLNNTNCIKALHNIKIGKLCQ